MKIRRLTPLFTAVLMVFILMPTPALSAVSSGNAWITGTFLTENGDFDWIPYEENKIAFQVGVPFTATLDFGGGTQTHGEAVWGYFLGVQTDLMDSTQNYDVYVDRILADGRSVAFNPDNSELGFDFGVRLAVTNMWSETPLVENPDAIGTFSKLEIIMVIVWAGQPSPFNATGETTPAPQIATAVMAAEQLIKWARIEAP